METQSAGRDFNAHVSLAERRWRSIQNHFRFAGDESPCFTRNAVLERRSKGGNRGQQCIEYCAKEEFIERGRRTWLAGQAEHELRTRIFKWQDHPRRVGSI